MRRRWTLGLLFASLGLASVFQNCAEPVDLSESDASTFSDTLPFAYDVNVDTFAYMSCAFSETADFDRRAMFNFRVGAYTNGFGLKLTDDFRQATANFTDAARADALFKSAKNSGAVVQLAARADFDYQRIILNSSNIVQNEFDIGNYFKGASLDSPGAAMSLSKLAEDERIHYFSGTPGLEGRLLEASLRYHYVLNDVISNKMKDARVALTFTANKEPLNVEARGPNINDLHKVVYGKVFRPQFSGPYKLGSPDVTIATTTNDRTVTGLWETDLIKQTTRQWKCPSEYRFTVIRPEDAAQCPRSVDAWTYDSPGNDLQKRQLEVIRRVLRVEDYYVNLALQCVVPKDPRNSCYPTNGGSNTVTPKYAGPCTDNPTTGVLQCPNFLSVCVHPDSGY